MSPEIVQKINKRVAKVTYADKKIKVPTGVIFMGLSEIRKIFPDSAVKTVEEYSLDKEFVILIPDKEDNNLVHIGTFDLDNPPNPTVNGTLIKK